MQPPLRVNTNKARQANPAAKVSDMGSAATPSALLHSSSPNQHQGKTIFRTQCACALTEELSSSKGAEITPNSHHFYGNIRQQKYRQSNIGAFLKSRYYEFLH